MSRRSVCVLAALVAASLGTAASARGQDEPVINRTPDARDVAMTPLTDLNLAKDPIPSVLLAAQADPYASAGAQSCEQIASALAPLESVLGPDMDLAETPDERISAGSVAKSVVASFIPFRGILRELTGAADHQRDFQAAVYAGAVRRGFLKGLGQQMGCAYPARPAFTRVAVTTKVTSGTHGEAVDAATIEQVAFVEEPVIQELPRGKRR